MNNNLQSISQVIDYIEVHLGDRLDLDKIAWEAGYSKYHLHRMFTGITGFSMHSYVQRRRLTEAARLLAFTDQPIMEIALFAGYETRQSFSTGFKALFKCSPQAFRNKKEFYPLQPVADYIYKEWFPQSTCQLNENAKYDFAKYGEITDKAGNSHIEYWVPII